MRQVGSRALIINPCPVIGPQPCRGTVGLARRKCNVQPAKVERDWRSDVAERVAKPANWDVFDMGRVRLTLVLGRVKPMGSPSRPSTLFVLPPERKAVLVDRWPPVPGILWLLSSSSEETGMFSPPFWMRRVANQRSEPVRGFPRFREAASLSPRRCRMQLVPHDPGGPAPTSSPALCRNRETRLLEAMFQLPAVDPRASQPWCRSDHLDQHPVVSSIGRGGSGTDAPKTLLLRLPGAEAKGWSDHRTPNAERCPLIVDLHAGAAAEHICGVFLAARPGRVFLVRDANQRTTPHPTPARRLRNPIFTSFTAQH